MSQYSNQKAYDDLSHKCKNIANKALEHFPKKGSKDEEDIIVYIYDFLGKMLTVSEHPFKSVTAIVFFWAYWSYEAHSTESDTW